MGTQGGGFVWRKEVSLDDDYVFFDASAEKKIGQMRKTATTVGKALKEGVNALLLLQDKLPRGARGEIKMKVRSIYLSWLLSVLFA